VPDMSFPVALFTDLAASIKAVVGVPVSRDRPHTNEPGLAERVLRDGQADLCVMTRALIADPDLPRKAKEGGSKTSGSATGTTPAASIASTPGGASPAFRRRVGREREWSELPKAVRPLQGVVVGGGPADSSAPR